LHPRADFKADALDDGSILRGFGPVLPFNVNGFKKDGVPLGRERKRDERESRDRDARPVRKAFPEAGLDLSKYRMDFRAAHGDERNDGRAVTQRNFHKVVAAETVQTISVAKTGEGAIHAFREDTEKVVVFKNTGGVFLSRKHASETSDDFGDGRKLEQAGLNQESWYASSDLDDKMQGHDGVPGNDAAVRAYENGASLSGKIFEARGFNAPIVLGKKAE